MSVSTSKLRAAHRVLDRIAAARSNITGSGRPVGSARSSGPTHHVDEKPPAKLPNRMPNAMSAASVLAKPQRQKAMIDEPRADSAMTARYGKRSVAAPKPTCPTTANKLKRARAS